jgi:hypothetical protein
VWQGLGALAVDIAHRSKVLSYTFIPGKKDHSMIDRAKWKRQQCLRVELLCIICLLIIWGFRSARGKVDSKEHSSFCYQDTICLDSPNCYDLAVAYEKLADIEPNSAEAFVHLSNCYHSMEDSKKPRQL